jgi:hypothetical protein
MKPTIGGGSHEVKVPKAAWVLWPCQKLPYWVEITDLSSIVEDHIETLSMVGKQDIYSSYRVPRKKGVPARPLPNAGTYKE